MSKKIIIFYIILMVLGQIFITVSYCQAGILESSNGNLQCVTSPNGANCTLNDFMSVAINVSKWVLGITGSLSLLAFIYGGVMFLISGGSSERVSKAKAIIFGAVIGLVIVFASYTIIGFIFKSLGINAQWFSITSAGGWLGR